MPKAPPICYESHSLEDAVAGRMIAGPPGYADRTSVEDYIDLSYLEDS